MLSPYFRVEGQEGLPLRRARQEPPVEIVRTWFALLRSGSMSWLSFKIKS
jgi:hypothetical protein